MHFRLTLPRLRPVLFGMLILGLQMAIFFAGAYLLSVFYNPPINETARDSFSAAVYPYALFELGIFVGASVIAFWVSGWKKETIAALVAAEVGVFVLVQFFSVLLGHTCGALISLQHYPVIMKPSCGMSSINPISFWFGAFLVLTVLLWEVVLQQRDRVARRYVRFVMGFEKPV